nr:repressor LexA [Pseudomonadota bacterium]
GAGLPLLGRVPAGRPLEAIQQLEASLDLRALFPRADYFLRVQSDSMIGAGIFDGDLIAVHRTEEARHGDIVVARLRDEDTVKRLYCRDGVIRLVPENPALAPITVGPGDDFAIDGVVIGSVRPRLK